MKALHKKESRGMNFAGFCRKTHDIFSGIVTSDSENVEFFINITTPQTKMAWKQVSGDIKVNS